MSSYTDQRALRNVQYRTDANLQARIALHAHYGTNPVRWPVWMFAQIDAPTGARVLEVGCGPGTIWQENWVYIPAGWRILLSDYSPGMVSQARANLGPRFHYAQLDAQAIPFPTGFFDVVIANHMLYHIPDRPRALAEFRRVLAEDGRLYANSLGLGHLKEMRALLYEADPTVSREAAAELFGLENGAALLAPHFGRIQLLRHEDSLEVDAVEPVVAYLRSGWRSQPLDDNPNRLHDIVAAKLHRDGVLHFTKEVGLFIAGNANAD